MVITEARKARPEDRAGRVLILDDSAVQSYLLSIRLAEMGVEADTATDIERTKQIISRTPPDLVLVELLMRPINGFEAGRRLMEGYGAACVLMTATGRDTDRQWAEKTGFAAVLARPCTTAALREVLRLPARERSGNGGAQ